MGIVGRRSADCIHHLRIRYHLPEPLDESLAALFPTASVRLNAFSRFVAGARDHLILAIAGHWRATGVVGDPEWTVVYYKTADHALEADVAAVEARLSERFGLVEDHGSVDEGA